MNEHKVLSPSASNSASAVLRAARSQGHMRSMSNNSNNLSVGGGSNSLSPDLTDDDDDDVLWRSGGGANGHLHHGAVHLTQQMQPPVDVLVGNLSKWTNYLHGWQERYFALKTDGNLVYYKSNNDTEFGCRGSISVQKAKVKRHELDELRFDVSVNDCNWYLRAKSLEDRQKWTDALENQKHHLQQQQQQQQLYGNNLKRHGSAHSLSSNSYSGSSSRPGGSAKARGLTEKLAEMETFRDIMCGQIDTLQAYFDSCADLEGQEQGENVAKEEERLAKGGKDPVKQAVDFKGEAITFKATTAGIVATLGHCIDLMNQREEMWRRRLEREQAARRAAEDKARSAVEFASGDPSVPAMRTSPSVLPKLAPPPLPPKMQAPDYEEGPHSQLGEDEFFDAVEDALDRLEEEQSSIDQLKRMGSVGAQKESAGSGDEEDADWKVEAATREHHLWGIIDKTTNEQLHYARLLPGGKDSVWELFAQDGEMRMYKREEEVDGMVVDPLKALHQVRGVSARELCHHFFSPDVRMEWETTLDKASVIEKVSDDTLLFLQLHKRIWPAATRDSCFWSHMRKITGGELKPDDAHDTYLVCNKSVEHPSAPSGQNGVLRVDLVVIFVCDTIIAESKRHLPRNQLTRDDLSCRITYCSVVNPGGWAPASALRTVYKREYPRFLKRFTAYVIDKSKGKPIMW